MARKKKNLFVEIWEWLLDIGVTNTIYILGTIYIIVLSIVLYALKLILKR